MADIEARRREFEVAGDEYEKHVFDDQTGGYVLIHQGHNRQQSFESELFVSKTFAQEGRGVKLVNEKRGEHVKSPDAEIDGQLWEFKQITPLTGNIARRIQEGIGKARGKGVSSIAFHIDRSDYDINSINRGVRQAFFYDPNEIVTEIALVFNDGRMWRLTREEWNDGQRF